MRASLGSAERPVDHPAADDEILAIEHDRLPRSHRALGLGESHDHLSRRSLPVLVRRERRRHRHVAVADLRRHVQRPVEVGDRDQVHLPAISPGT